MQSRVSKGADDFIDSGVSFGSSYHEYNSSERWEDYGECVKESRKDIYGLESTLRERKDPASKAVSLRKDFTD